MLSSAEEVYRGAFCPEGELANSTITMEDVYKWYETKSQMENGSLIYQEIEDLLYSKVAVAIGVLGLIGNMLNLLVLSQKGLQTSMGRMEKFAHTGLISLALSDMLFCVVVIPHGFVPNHYLKFDTIGFQCIYYMYKYGVINIFILLSTMLTVTMAAGRYFAIVHPIKARQFIGMTCARRCMILVFIACVGFNIPRFWRYKLIKIECLSGQKFYIPEDGPYKNFEVPYLYCYLVFGILLPLLILGYCNMFLIRALRQSKNRMIRFRKNETQQETSQRITLTLVIIVIFYMLFVIPAEVITLCKEFFGREDSVISTDKLNLAAAIVNVLQAINFAFNFVLYCIINTHFRSIIHDVVRCRWHALMNKRNGHYDSSVGESGLGSSVRSTGQTSMRTYVYHAKSVINGSCKLQEDNKIGTTAITEF